MVQGGVGFPSGKKSSYNPGDVGPVPGLGRFPGGGNGNPPQCSFLGNPMDRGAWRATVHGVAKSKTPLSDETTGRSTFGLARTRGSIKAAAVNYTIKSRSTQLCPGNLVSA